MSYNAATARIRFPALQTETVFLDNAAGSQVPQHVIDRTAWALREANVNQGGAYRQSLQITEEKERVCRLVSELINAPSPIWFGPNATTLISLVAAGLTRSLEPGDEIVITGLDHHANVDPWRKTGADVRVWEPRDDSRLHLADLLPLVNKRTRIVAMTAASNALGTITDVAAVANEIDCWLFVDAVHYAPHRLPDVQAMGADLLVFSPYKVFGPHLGALYVSDAVLERLPDPGLSFFTSPNWEPGTQNHEAIAGLGGTFDYFEEMAPEPGRAGWVQLFGAFQNHEDHLIERMLSGLRDRGATLYGLPGAEGRTSTVSFNIGDKSPREVAEHLATRDVAVADGHYYAYDLMMGLTDGRGAVRASIVHYNTVEDVDRFLDAIPV